MDAKELLNPVLDVILEDGEITEELDSDYIYDSHEIEVGDYTVVVEVRWDATVVDNGFHHAFGYEYDYALERAGHPFIEELHVYNEDGECGQLGGDLYELLENELK